MDEHHVHRRMGLNLCHQYLVETNQTLDDFRGLCVELIDEVMHWLDPKPYTCVTLDGVDGRELSPMGSNENWDIHQVIEVDGLIHDGWWPEPLPLDEYLKAQFPFDDVEVWRHKE